MESKSEFIAGKNYVLSTVSGEANIRQIMETVLHAYKIGEQNDCYSFLTDCSGLFSERNSTIIEEFELIEFYKEISKFKYFVEAIVLPVDNYAKEGMLFFETISANRGMMIKTFANFGEAEAWLD